MAILFRFSEKIEGTRTYIKNQRNRIKRKLIACVSFFNTQGILRLCVVIYSLFWWHIWMMMTWINIYSPQTHIRPVAYIFELNWIELIVSTVSTQCWLVICNLFSASIESLPSHWDSDNNYTVCVFNFYWASSNRNRPITHSFTAV